MPWLCKRTTSLCLLLGLGLATASCRKATKKQEEEATVETLPTAPIAKRSTNPEVVSALRFTSLAIRDLPPTFTEIDAVDQGLSTIAQLKESYLSEEGHALKVRRFFADLLAMPVYLGSVFSEHYLLKRNAAGALRLTGKDDCAPTDVVQQEAWWLPEGQTDTFCRSSTSEFFRSGQLTCDSPGANGLEQATCGCGPYQLLCYPQELFSSLQTSLTNEAGERGLYVYQHDLLWQDFLAGDFLVADRNVYYAYVRMQYELVRGMVPPEETVKILRSLEADVFTRIAPPSGPPRAGVVTSPAFMWYFNNPRARVRALTQAFLCQDVDAGLNTAGLQEFVNPSLSAQDRAHGTMPGCSGCHYALDNQASVFLRYDQLGGIKYYLAEMPSDLGHAFGYEGEGPAFLAQTLVSSGPGFASCMAKRAWQAFVGVSWDSVSTADRVHLTEAAQKAPQTLLQAIFDATSFVAASDSEVATQTLSQSYKQQCAVCHGATGAGSVGPQLPGLSTAAEFRAVVRSGKGAMPAFSSDEVSDGELNADFILLKTGIDP